MQNRRKLLLLTGCVLAMVGLPALFARSPEPTQWLTIYGRSLPGGFSFSDEIDLQPSTGDPAATAALTHFGTDALPTLLAWLRDDRHASSVKTMACRALSKTPQSAVRNQRSRACSRAGGPDECRRNRPGKFTLQVPFGSFSLLLS